MFRVRTEFVAPTREMRVHVLCECGSGAWLAAIAPFPDLFFDERALIGRTVGEGLAWLRRRYGEVRLLTGLPNPVRERRPPRRRGQRKGRGERPPAQQRELAIDV